jgi:NOL1/NOP2/fmu family ribosome biogenesis protein
MAAAHLFLAVQPANAFVECTPEEMSAWMFGKQINRPSSKAAGARE